MAFTGKALRSKIQAVRNAEFDRRTRHGAEKRHPDRPATVYRTDGGCVRLRSDSSKRPEKHDKSVQFTTVTVAPIGEGSEKASMTTEQARDNLRMKAAAVGLTYDQWKEYTVWKKKKADAGEAFSLSMFKEEIGV